MVTSAELDGGWGVIGTMLADMKGALSSVVDGAAWLSLVVMAAAVIFKGIRTRAITGVPGRSAAALVVMLLGLYLVYGLLPEGRFSLSGWAAHTESSWSALMSTTGQTMIGYYLVALVGVATVFVMKSLLHRHE